MRKGNAQEVTRKEHIAETEAKRVQLVDPFGGVITEGNYTSKIDVASSTVTYIGKAQIGASTSDPVWQIKRILVSGNITTISWANGTDAFTNVFDNRAAESVSYS